MSVSPSYNVLRQRSRAGRLVVAPVRSSLKIFPAPGFLQGGELQGGVLVLGREAGVTVFHARDYETSNLKHSSPLFTGLPSVFHNLPILMKNSGRESD